MSRDWVRGVGFDQVRIPIQDADDLPAGIPRLDRGGQITEFMPGAGPPPHRIPSRIDVILEPDSYAARDLR
jgi:hypothetical protein